MERELEKGFWVKFYGFGVETTDQAIAEYFQSVGFHEITLERVSRYRDNSAMVSFPFHVINDLINISLGDSELNGNKPKIRPRSPMDR